MALLVQKFGGTSLATLDHLRRVARCVAANQEQGHQIVVVVSAMAGTTNQLSDWLKEISPTFPFAQPAADLVLSSGEQITCGLLTLALKELGLEAKAWAGWQIPILTDGNHSNAQIQDIPTTALKQSLDAGEIAVVAGFQGISPEGYITTLGRGGSDTTAVALAAYLKADRCDIYTDVEGVFTADPRYIQDAKRLETLTYDEMLSLAASGAKVLHPHAAEFAKAHQLKLRILSSLGPGEGTSVSNRPSSPRLISGITHTAGFYRARLEGLTPQWHFGLLDSLFDEYNLVIEAPSVLWNETGTPQRASFASNSNTVPALVDALEKHKDKLGIASIALDTNLAQLSLIKGSQWNDGTPPCYEIPSICNKLGIESLSLSTHPHKISFLVDPVHVHPLTYLLHQVYELHRV